MPRPCACGRVFKTGAHAGFQGLVEFDLVGNIGTDDYNDSINGKTRYPLIADPATEVLNQLWVSWAGLPQTTAKLGRQAINLDNQRFIGTVGLRLKGEQTFTRGTFFYEAEAAEQEDHGNNPARYDATYYHISPGATFGGLSLSAGFESVGGDGQNAFQTPLATLHAFNGWADKFLTTPANGLEDSYGKISYTIPGAGAWTDNMTFDALYHDYNAANTEEIPRRSGG